MEDDDRGPGSYYHATHEGAEWTTGANNVREQQQQHKGKTRRVNERNAKRQQLDDARTTQAVMQWERNNPGVPIPASKLPRRSKMEELPSQEINPYKGGDTPTPVVWGLLIISGIVGAYYVITSVLAGKPLIQNSDGSHWP